MTNVTHWIGGWVSPRAGLDMWWKEKSLPQQGIEFHLSSL
jgi:hypothetical protein